MAVPLGHRSTAKSKLFIDWRTADTRSEEKFAADDVIRELRGSDPRPLFVWVAKPEPVQADAGAPADKTAEKVVDKTRLDDLIDRSLGNEMVQLASGWFHCVKLPEAVYEKSHPFNALFAGKNPPRIVLAGADGKRVEALGTVQQKLDWRDVMGVLARHYRKSAEQAVKSLQRVLMDYDTLDAEREEVAAQLKRAEDAKNARKIEKAKARIAELDAEATKLQEQETKLRDLGLKGESKEKGD
jgi:hypothetical protein